MFETIGGLWNLIFRKKAKLAGFESGEIYSLKWGPDGKQTVTVLKYNESTELGKVEDQFGDKP